MVIFVTRVKPQRSPLSRGQDCSGHICHEGKTVVVTFVTRAGFGLRMKFTRPACVFSPSYWNLTFPALRSGEEVDRVIHVYLFFIINLKKAYDTIDLHGMLQIQRVYGVYGGKLLKAVKLLYI